MAQLTYIGKQAKVKQIPSHAHEGWEIIYYTHGEGVLTFYDQKKIAYRKHDLVIVPPGVLHSNQSETGFKNIHLTIEDWNCMLKQPVIVTDPNRHLYQLLNQLIVVFAAGNRRRLILSNYLDLILNLIVDMTHLSGYSEYVEQMISELTENYADAEFDIGALIRSLPYHPDYIRKLFLKEVGFTPLQYLTKIRIENAKKLLLERQKNHLKIDEISFMCGFQDQLYFSRIFKKMTGVSPREYESAIIHETTLEQETKPTP